MLEEHFAIAMALTPERRANARFDDLRRRQCRISRGKIGAGTNIFAKELENPLLPRCSVFRATFKREEIYAACYRDFEELDSQAGRSCRSRVQQVPAAFGAKLLFSGDF